MYKKYKLQARSQPHLKVNAIAISKSTLYGVQSKVSMA